MKRILFLFGLLILNSCTYNELIPACEPDEQMFYDLVQPIIESNCIQCHSESGSRPETPLEIYEGVINALNNHSLRDRVINREMPPYGETPMSESDIKIIKNWIDCE